MFDQKTTTFIEIPPSLAQLEIWNLEKQLRLVEGVETDIRDSKDITAVTLLVISIATTAAGAITAIAGGVKTVYEVAKILHDFLHRISKNQVNDKVEKIVIVKKGKRIELYNLPIEEIERILKEH